MACMERQVTPEEAEEDRATFGWQPLKLGRW